MDNTSLKGNILLTAPGKITEGDWNYYLQQSSGDYINSIVDSLKSKNRFFVDERFLKLLYACAFDVGSRFQFQRFLYAKQNHVLYRARKYEENDYEERMLAPENYGDFQGYGKEDSFVPPADKSCAGRINPDNIRYLYTASDVETSILEVKAQPGEYVSVAKIRLKEDVRMFDLTKSHSGIDADTAQKSEWINFFAINLTCFFQRPYVDNGSYYFCQYVSEYMKNWGFDGIMFRSSMQPTKTWGNVGINCTFFNYDKCEVCSSKLYHVIQVDVSTFPGLEQRT